MSKNTSKNSSPWIAKSHRFFVIFLLSFFVLSQGCYNYRVVSKGDPEQLVPEKRTKWSFAWGLIQSRTVQADCRNDAIDQVVVKTNLGYILISVVTAGIVVPVQMEWYCSKKEIPPGKIGSKK